MRFAIYDGILETHVASSLERAMRTAGHEVYNTGKIGHGFTFASGTQELQRLRLHLESVLDWNPDVIFVFRPASLPYELLQRAKSTGAKLIVWLSDDPVLWDLTYGPVLEDYDLVLHCGTERVLSFYEEQFGRPTGVNFPFWTDSIAFPYVFGNEERETQALFLGNVHDTVRRRRYFDLGSLTSSVRIHGGVGTDYYNLWGGFLDSDQEVVQAGARAAVAINIPQYFKDHRGLETWFPGLDRLGFFQYPSRVIQYAAMGLPIISVVPTPEDLNSFPEIVTVPSMRELDEAIQNVSSSPDLQDLSLRTYQRFRNNYSAESRVLAIESLLHDDSWRSLSVAERADWFLQFVPGANSQRTEPSEKGSGTAITVQAAPDLATPAKTVSLPETSNDGVHSAMVIGTGFGRVTSSSAVVARALRTLGHKVTTSDAWNSPFLMSDKNDQFRYLLDGSALQEHAKSIPDVIFITDIDCGLTQSSLEKLKVLGVRLCVVDASSNSINAKFELLAGRVDLLCTNNPDLAQKAQERGLTNVLHLPPLVDKAFIDLASRLESRRDELVLVGKRALHLDQQAPAFKDLPQITSSTLIIEDSPKELKSLPQLAEALNVAVILAAHDASRPGPLPSELLPFAMASGALVVTPRGVGPMHLGTPGVQVLCVREAGELKRKLARLALSQRGEADGYVAAAGKLVRTILLAEARLREVLGMLVVEENNEQSPASAMETQGHGHLDLRLTRNSAFELQFEPDNKTLSTLRIEVQHSLKGNAEQGLEFHVTALATGDSVGESVEHNGQTSILEFHFPSSQVDGRIRLSTTQAPLGGTSAVPYEGRLVRVSWHGTEQKRDRLEIRSGSPTSHAYRRVI